MTQNDEEVPENNSKNNNSSNTGDKEETPLDKALRKARARKEIERLTSGPDGIYDAETSLKKVKGISPGLPEDSVEYVEDKKYYELESQMLQAVQKGDFEQASEKRDEIDRMHVDDCGFVLQANTKFYKAFSEKNLEEMEKIWCASDASAVQCIHPSHQPIIGYKHVIESWKSMFNSKDETFQMNTMEPTNLRLSVKGATAWLTCDEEVYKPKFIRGKGKTKELVKKMLATNIFRKVDGKWLMVHHHATAQSESNSNGKKNKGSNGGLNNKNAVQSTIIRLGDSNDYGSPSSSSNSSSKDGSVKRVFMGSISDLLGGNLGDILGDGSGSSSSNSKDDIFNLNGGKAIIRLNSDFDVEDIDDDMIDDEDDDDDEIEDASSLPIRLGGFNSNDGGDGSIEITDIVTTNTGNNNNSNKSQFGVPKDALRQNCISALRKLCVQGSISQKQKRILLTDIITCSAKGEFSMVEVAYELLCGEGESSDENTAEEEFAEQCRVFASNLPEYPH